MIRFTWYELLWLFFIYSFLGWVLETAAATVKQKKFANRGLVNGPFCVIYGIAALFMTFGLQELRGVWLFLFATIYATVIEWIAGHLIEKAFKARWWDYSRIKWNLDGYICIPASLIWGALGYLGIRWGNRFAIIVFKMLPLFLMKILVWFFLAYWLWISSDLICCFVEKGRTSRGGKLRMKVWIKSAISLEVRFPDGLGNVSKKRIQRQWN